MGITQYLGKEVEVTIDRKKGSLHPEYGFVYPINYGYIKGTVSGDGKEIDAFILGVDELLDVFIGVCIAIVERLDDNDPKLIVVPAGKKYTCEEIEKEIYFQEKYFTHILIMYS
jgi:inorganic pyrophosphatase